MDEIVKCVQAEESYEAELLLVCGWNPNVKCDRSNKNYFVLLQFLLLYEVFLSVTIYFPWHC